MWAPPPGTSSPAAIIFLACRALMSAASSTTGPRQALISTVVGFMRLNSLSLIIPLVCRVSGNMQRDNIRGAQQVIKSDPVRCKRLLEARGKFRYVMVDELAIPALQAPRHALANTASMPMMPTVLFCEFRRPGRSTLSGYPQPTGGSSPPGTADAFCDRRSTIKATVCSGDRDRITATIVRQP